MGVGQSLLTHNKQTNKQLLLFLLLFFIIFIPFFFTTDENRTALRSICFDDVSLEPPLQQATAGFGGTNGRGHVLAETTAIQNRLLQSCGRCTGPLLRTSFTTLT